MSVEVVTGGPVAEIVLRRPDVLNAMSFEVFDGLARAADEVGGSSDARVVLVRGEGRSFSSGIDVSSLGSGEMAPEAMIARAQAGFRKIAALEIPTVAAVQGHALGAGLQLALACDLRVVAEDASLGLLEARFGIIPDLCGTQRLPLLVGAGRATKMIWLAERIDGAEAGRIGLAEVVVASAAVEAEARALAERLAAAPPLAVRAVKALVDRAARVDLSEGMDGEAAAQAKALASADFGEGVSAFLSKRPAAFEGR